MDMHNIINTLRNNSMQIMLNLFDNLSDILSETLP